MLLFIITKGYNSIDSDDDGNDGDGDNLMRVTMMVTVMITDDADGD